MKTIKVKLHNPKCAVVKIRTGDWIDLKAAETVVLDKGEYYQIPLGVSMVLPRGYEAHVVPRSSTYWRWHIILANGVGIIDESYCGDNDEWCFSALATESTVIHEGDRICQFRIMKKMPKLKVKYKETLNKPDRGGLGSTGGR